LSGASSRPGGGAHRGGTFTLAYAHNPIDTIDPAISYSGESWQLLSLTGDGLTAFRRVGGAEGSTVVPDLATDLPTPTDGGRTYTFRLRRGIRYSTGVLVEPQDIRFALERDFELGSPVPASYYSNIVGASGCHKGRPCDLSRGIVVTGDMIVFHLTTPGPELLERLALPFAYVVPSSVPHRAAGTEPLPSTGPYAIVSYDPRRSLVLKRNPHFHEWSQAARPDGFPNEIVVKFGVSGAAATSAVERGDLDFACCLPNNLINEVTTRYASQLHVNSIQETSSLIMNTRLAPFNSRDARRALSYALDRSELIRRTNGLPFAQPTCQILPPNFPGYKPYCPFTLPPATTGSWQAPDLARAAKLVDRSHTRGMHVVVVRDATDGGRHIGSYLVDLLDRLGYRASQKAFPYPTIARSGAFAGSRASMQIYPNEWFADYPSAAAFIQSSFACGGATNDGGFCDPRIDREMRRAVTLEITDPRAANDQWSHIDHELVDAAAWIPYSNGKELDLVSRRVGNFQYHPAWGALFDQLWVR
jgi:peptide/nickel transport system substrate-binding protein